MELWAPDEVGIGNHRNTQVLRLPMSLLSGALGIFASGDAQPVKISTFRVTPSHLWAERQTDKEPDS